MAKRSRQSDRNLIAANRRARQRYAIDDRIEAGISLLGSEVKSCRARRVQIQDAYVQVMRGEAMLINSHIAQYDPASHFNHDPVRPRKLLLHRREIDRLEVRLRQHGEAAVPLSMYFKEGKVKVELGVGKGLSHADRRDVVREREMQREIDRAMRRRR